MSSGGCSVNNQKCSQNAENELNANSQRYCSDQAQSSVTHNVRSFFLLLKLFRKLNSLSMQSVHFKIKRTIIYTYTYKDVNFLHEYSASSLKLLLIKFLKFCQ